MSEVDFRSDDVRRQIINMDEIHHDQSITWKGWNKSASVFKSETSAGSNPKRQQGFKKAFKCGKHVTGVFATNTAGKALPPLFIF